MPAGVAHFPDPGIEFGSFKVLPQTTGGWIIIDSRKEPGYRRVGPVFKKLEMARDTAKAWHEAGHG